MRVFEPELVDRAEDHQPDDVKFSFATAGEGRLYVENDDLGDTLLRLVKRYPIVCIQRAGEEDVGEVFASLAGQAPDVAVGTIPRYRRVLIITRQIPVQKLQVTSLSPDSYTLEDGTTGVPTAYVKAGDIEAFIDEENGVWGTSQTAAKFDPDGTYFDTVSVSTASVGGTQLQVISLYLLPIPLGLTGSAAGSGAESEFPTPTPPPIE